MTQMGVAVGVRSLVDLEQVIEENLKAAFTVGFALNEISGRELYREAGFEGFEEYLQSKPWGLSRAHAYRQIDASKVHELVSPMGDINERQARELAPLMKKSTPEVVRQVYAEVLDEAGDPVKVTAAAIKEKVREVLPPPNERSTYGKSLKRVKALIAIVDKFIEKGVGLPEDAFLDISTTEGRQYHRRLLKAREVLDGLIDKADIARKEV